MHLSELAARRCKVAFIIIGTCNLHFDIHNVWMYSSFGEVDEKGRRQSEKEQNCSSCVCVCTPARSPARRIAQCTDGAAEGATFSAASLRPALWWLPGLPAAPGAVSLCVSLSVFGFFFLRVWYYSYHDSPLLTASRNSRQGLLSTDTQTQIHMWAQWNLGHMLHSSCCLHGINHCSS